MTNFFSRLTANIQRLWHRLPLREQGLLTAALPLLAVVFSAVMAYFGNGERQRLEAAITRHFQMIEHLANLQTELLDAETGLRGHLLARRKEFLEPYDLAASSLPKELESLRALVEGEPGAKPRREKLARLTKISETVQQEMALLESLRAFIQKRSDTVSTSEPNESLDAQLLQSKETMDKLRAQLSEMRGEEERLLALRLQDIRDVRRRDYFTIAGALLLGLATRSVVFWLFNRRIAWGIRRLTQNVRCLRAGQPLPHSPSTSQDDMGELEREVAAVAARGFEPSLTSPMLDFDHFQNNEISATPATMSTPPSARQIVSELTGMFRKP